MDFDEFLRASAPLFGLQWRPFQRRGIKRKVELRIAQIGLSHFEEYLLRIKTDPKEQSSLSQILTVTISRFFRDREVFLAIENFIIPTLLKEKEREKLQIWSIGCASGEEPYSLFLLWKERFEKDWPSIPLSIVATDINENLLERAKESRYKKSSLRELNDEELRDFFKRDDGFYRLNQSARENVKFKRHDIINEELFSGMDMVFCRNLAFTYFSKKNQMDVLKKIAISLKKGGYLVIGKDEFLPLVYPTLFVPIFPIERIYQKFHLNYINEEVV